MQKENRGDHDDISGANDQSETVQTENTSKNFEEYITEKRWMVLIQC